MASPTPKPADHRRNRNPKRSGDWVQLPREGHQGPIPELPASLQLGTETYAWWDHIWRTPMATQWDPGDIPALVELAILRNRLMQGAITVASEVRLRSDQFGLTPEGRQKRRWIVTDEDLERALPTEGARKRHLRVVAAD